MANLSCLNVTAVRHSPFWMPARDALEVSKLAVNLVGMVGNFALFLLLGRRPLGSRLATLFFRCQSLADLGVCLIASAFALQPKLWLVPHTSHAINYLICNAWHSQVLYWFFVQLSIVNLILIGLERYWAVTKPLFYKQLDPNRHGVVCLLIANIYAAIFAIPNLWETTYLPSECEVPVCVAQKNSPGEQLMLKAYSIAWFLGVYLLGLCLLIFCYTRVIGVLKSSPLCLDGRSNKKERAARDFTRLALVITVAYILCITYDAVAYVLGRTGLWAYKYGTLPHKMGIFVVSLNSFLNPCIYFSFVMRRKLAGGLNAGRKSSCCCFSREGSGRDGGDGRREEKPISETCETTKF